MKKIKVYFSKCGDLEGLRPISKIANTLYEAERSKIPILMDEETMIIYAPICTKDHFEAFYGKVFEEEEKDYFFKEENKND